MKFAKYLIALSIIGGNSIGALELDTPQSKYTRLTPVPSLVYQAVITKRFGDQTPALAIDNNRSKLLMGGECGDLQIFNFPKLECQSTQRKAHGVEIEEKDEAGHNLIGYSEVNSVVSPDNNLWVSASEDGTIKVWESSLDNDKLSWLHTYSLGLGQISAMIVNRNKYILTGCTDGMLGIYPLLNHANLGWNTESHSTKITALAQNTAGTVLASAAQDEIALWEIKEDEKHDQNKPTINILKRIKNHHQHPIHGLSFNADDTRLASRDKSTLKLWNGINGDHVGTFYIKDISSVEFHPENPSILLYTAGKRTGILDIISGVTIHSFLNNTPLLKALWAPERSRDEQDTSTDLYPIITSTTDNKVKLWKLLSAAQKNKLVLDCCIVM